MALFINISNISKVGNNTYSVEFNSNFGFQNLFYEISTDGVNWSSPVELPQTSSPQNIIIPLLQGFNLRLSSDYIAPTPYSKIHSAAFNQVFN